MPGHRTGSASSTVVKPPTASAPRAVLRSPARVSPNARALASVPRPGTTPCTAPSGRSSRRCARRAAPGQTRLPALGVKSVFCVFGVGLNSLCILCIWGPQNRSTAVVYFCVSVPRSNTPVFWCIWTPHLVYLTPRLPAPLAHPLSCEEEARTGRFSTSQAETRRWWPSHCAC